MRLCTCKKNNAKEKLTQCGGLQQVRCQVVSGQSNTPCQSLCVRESPFSQAWKIVLPLSQPWQPSISFTARHYIKPPSFLLELCSPLSPTSVDCKSSDNALSSAFIVDLKLSPISSFPLFTLVILRLFLRPTLPPMPLSNPLIA